MGEGEEAWKEKICGGLEEQVTKSISKSDKAACHAKIYMEAVITQRGGGAHLRLVDPVSLWWWRTHPPDTGAVNNRVTNVCFPRVFLSTLLSIIQKGWTDTWVSCTPTAPDRDWNQVKQTRIELTSRTH